MYRDTDGTVHRIGINKHKTPKQRKNRKRMGVSYHLPNLQLPPPVSYWNVITIHEGRFLNINLIQIMKKMSQTSYASKI